MHVHTHTQSNCNAGCRGQDKKRKYTLEVTDRLSFQHTRLRAKDTVLWNPTSWLVFLLWPFFKRNSRCVQELSLTSLITTAQSLALVEFEWCILYDIALVGEGVQVWSPSALPKVARPDLSGFVLEHHNEAQNEKQTFIRNIYSLETFITIIFKHYLKIQNAGKWLRNKFWAGEMT